MANIIQCFALQFLFFLPLLMSFAVSFPSAIKKLMKLKVNAAESCEKLFITSFLPYFTDSHVLIDKRQSNPLEGIKMSALILCWNREHIWKHGSFDVLPVSSSDDTRVKTLLTGIGALRENISEGAVAPSSSECSSTSHTWHKERNKKIW